MIDWEEELKALRADVAKLLSRGDGLQPRAVRYERAAELLSISPTKLKGLIRNGAIVPVKIGGRKMIPVSELDRISTPRLPKRIEATAPKKTHDGRAAAAAFRASLKNRG